MCAEKIRIGLWGCGNRTRTLIENAVKNEDITISCCYDLNTNTAEELANKLNARVVSSYDELLKADDVDAILICLYPGGHAKALLEALPTGKPIYIEKPIATNWEDYYNVAEIATKYNTTTVHVGLMHRYNPFFITLTDLVQSGKIGNLISMSLNWICKLRPIESFPGGRDNWHFKEDTGGELIQHFCHVFDWLRVLQGDFSNVTAMSNHLNDDGTTIEDTWDILLRYKTGVLVNLHSSMNNSRNIEMGWIEGSEGSLEWEWSSTPYIKYFAKNHKREVGESIVLKSSSHHNKDAGFDMFLDAVRNKRPGDITVQDGLWASLIPLMARKSAEKGLTLTFDTNDPTR